MNQNAGRRGQPVWVMAALLGGWVAMRAVSWDALAVSSGSQAPLLHPALAAKSQLVRMRAKRPLPVVAAAHGGEARSMAGYAPAVFPPAVMTIAPTPAWDAALVKPAPHSVTVVPAPVLDALQSSVPGAPLVPPSRPAVAAAHQLLWMAAVANLPGPQELIAQFGAGGGNVGPSNVGAGTSGAGFSGMRGGPQAAGVPAKIPAMAGFAPDAFALARVAQNQLTGPQLVMAAAPARRVIAPLPRWSADGWVLLRRGSVPAAGLAGPTYGAAQAGAVLRYRLIPASAMRPTAYVAGYAALNGSGERQMGAGLSLRPVPGLPIAAMAEMRASRFANGALHWRPAAMLVSEFAPVELPLALRAEAYVAGGYVGGRGATGFVDGQLRIDRSVLPAHRRAQGLDVRLGGGVWGGQQDGVSRLDIGPSLSVGLSGGAAAARLAADWRFRISGNAAPKSGPALTISAGF